MIRICSIIVSDKDNRILLQHRDANAPTYPNMWGLWGGRLEGKETPVQAAIRELKEELDIDVSEDELALFTVHRGRYFDDEWEGNFFHLKDKGNFKYRLQEGDDLRFFSHEDIKDIDLGPITTPIIERYFEKSL